MILESGIIAATDVQQRATEHGQKPNGRKPSINQIQDAHILIQLPLKTNTLNNYRRRKKKKNEKKNRNKTKPFCVRQQQCEFWLWTVCFCVQNDTRKTQIKWTKKNVLWWWHLKYVYYTLNGVRLWVNDDNNIYLALACTFVLMRSWKCSKPMIVWIIYVQLTGRWAEVKSDDKWKWKTRKMCVCLCACGGCVKSVNCNMHWIVYDVRVWLWIQTETDIPTFSVVILLTLRIRRE